MRLRILSQHQLAETYHDLTGARRSVRSAAISLSVRTTMPGSWQRGMLTDFRPARICFPDASLVREVSAVPTGRISLGTVPQSG